MLQVLLRRHTYGNATLANVDQHGCKVDQNGTKPNNLNPTQLDFDEVIFAKLTNMDRIATKQ